MTGVRGLLGVLASLMVMGPALAEPTPARQDRLKEMVAQDCGSCHGMTRKGGLGPSLQIEDMSRLSAEAVVETILEGRPGTPMPPWKTMLSRDEATWIAAYLMGEVQ